MILELWILILVLLISLGVGLFFITQEKSGRTEKTKEHKTDKTYDAENGVQGLEKMTIHDVNALKLRQDLERVIIGQQGMVHGLILGLFSGKHVLIQSLPGMAKTTAVKALASITGLQFGRIQGTPDLLPSDIVGIELAFGHQHGLHSAIQEKTRNRKSDAGDLIKKGPIFANIVLFDEINRTTPKVQSAFIQAMEEAEVTIGHETIELPKPFIVFATCNPLGSKGVYDLPEAQLDRFGLGIVLDYPKNEREIILGGRIEKSKDGKIENAVESILSIDFELVYVNIQNIQVSEEILDFITGIIQKTRNSPEYIQVGCSPRAGKDLLRLSKTIAFLAGKKSVDQTDVELLIESVLSHRIIWKRGTNPSNFFGLDYFH